MNSTMVPQSVAFRFGERDAKNGAPSNPAMFAQSQQQAEYTAGYNSVAATTITTPNHTRNDGEYTRKVDANVGYIFQLAESRTRRIANLLSKNPDGDLLWL